MALAEELSSVYCDLHVHIGRTSEGQAVKISGSRDLTFAGIAREAAERKGIGLIGIIDSHSPGVLRDIHTALDSGEMTIAAGGGIAYRGTTILLGTEIEIREPGRRECHVLAFMPDLGTMEDFSTWMSAHMRNVSLSSQRLYAPSRVLQDEITGRGGLLIPAHIFTPHKGLYGCAAERMAELFDLDRIAAVELGLSADSEMAGYISELDRYSFLTNSDAHSLGKIGREYNVIEMREPSFEELKLALRRSEGRRVSANFGLNPRLGNITGPTAAAAAASSMKPTAPRSAARIAAVRSWSRVCWTVFCILPTVRCRRFRITGLRIIIRCRWSSFPASASVS